MKKILFLLTAFVALAGLYSCSDDDDNPYAHVSSITVDSTAVVFQAAASTGYIAVNAPSGISNVTSSASWCTAAADGNKVNISVTQNDNLEGRTSEITIYSGSDSTQVTVQQLGLIFKIENGRANDNNIFVSNDEVSSNAYYFKHNLNLQFSTETEWIKAERDGDSLRITLDENATGNPRQGYVYYTCGTLRDSISVTQFDIDKDILGDYNLYYTNSNGSERSYAMNLYRHDDGTYALRFTSGTYSRNGFEIPVTLGTDEPTITINNLDSVGMYTYRDVEYHVMALVMYTNGEHSYRHSSPELQAVGRWYNDDGYSYYSFDVSGYLGSGWDFYALRLALSTDGTYDNIASTLTNLYYAELSKAIDDEDSEAKLHVPYRP